MTRKRVGIVLVSALVIACVAFFVRPARHAPSPAEFVGGKSCIECHKEQDQLWAGSHHDLAMMPATPETVLGAFDGAEFNDGTITSTFSRVGDRYYVRTEGPDGTYDEFPISHTFGVEPLQQYLIDLPGGRKQALTIAWDTAEQRWYSLYPGSSVEPGDWLHWSQRGQNWNSNCAECHSTNLKKNYDPRSDSYQTTWEQIDVGCESCHGPGSNHVAWANANAAQRWWAGSNDGSLGLAIHLKDKDRAWGIDAEGRPTLAASSQPDPTVQVEMCARCHARRAPISEQYRHGEGLLDHYVPQLIQENIYHPDGQIRDEVYEYGSFAQSRMYHKGVRCSDCHEPHSTRLYVAGNALCTRCHQAEKYDAPSHHFHTTGSTGASCVECHMPSRKYMVIDPRRDHSLRVPRPDLSLSIGVPNACTQCHTDQTDSWAAESVQSWYGPKTYEQPHHGQVLQAAWNGDPDSATALRKLMLDLEAAPYVRASAAAALQGYMSQQTIDAARSVLNDSDPLVRTMGAGLVGAAPPEQRVRLLAPLLDDPVRAVRQVAARRLLDVGRDALEATQVLRMDQIVGQQLRAALAHSDNVGGRMALAALYEDLRRPDSALAAYEAAFAMDRHNIDAGMALAEFHIRHNQDDRAEPLLRQLMKESKPPELPEPTWRRARGTIRYQLGLLVASNPQRVDEGIAHLRSASVLLPDSARLQYNLGQAFRHVNQPAEAEAALRKAHELDKADADVIQALIEVYISQGRHEQADAYRLRLAELASRHPYAARVLAEMNSRTSNPLNR